MPNLELISNCAARPRPWVPTCPPLLRGPLAYCAVTLLVVTQCLCPTSARAERTSALQLTLEAYDDDATHTQKTTINRLDTRETTEVGRGLAAAIGLNWLLPISDFLRVGPGMRYFSSYRFTPDDGEDNAGEDTLLGSLFELYVRGEFTIRLPGKLSLAPALEAGIPLMFPAGDLERRLNTLESQGYNVNHLPRIGFLVGAELSVRYAILPWLAARAGIGLQHERILLYDASVDIGFGQVSSHLRLMRLRAVAGVETTF